MTSGETRARLLDFHGPECDSRFASVCGDSQRCDCGLDAALAAYEQALIAPLIQERDDWRRAFEEANLGAAVCPWEHVHERDAKSVATDGWMCEAHPGTTWPHGDCPGPGQPWVLHGRCAIEAFIAERIAERSK